MEVSTLNYRGPGAAGPRHRNRPLVPLVICLVVAPAAVLICLRIEMLNSRAGHILPRTERGKWRVSFVQSEASWRRLQSQQDKDATWATRTLTSIERAQMQAEVDANVAGGELRDLVSTAGLLQYLLVPVLLLSSLRLFRTSRSRAHICIATAALASAAACGAMAFHRAYFTSLGW